MTIRIRFRGTLSTKIPGDCIEIGIKGTSTLQAILEKALSDVPEAKEVWQTTEQMDREALLLKNGKDIGLLDGLDTIVKEGDEIVILPLIHGG